MSSSLEEILGPSLLVSSQGKKRVQTSDVLLQNEFILLYFSASWCGPCKAFTPALVKFHEQAKQKNTEIILISSDRTQDEFDAYFAKMPWLALDFAARNREEELSQLFGVRGIPTLLVLDARNRSKIGRCLFTTSTALEEIQKLSGNATALIIRRGAVYNELIDSWKTMETCSLAEAASKIKDENRKHPLVEVLMFVLKNPVLWVGMYLAYRYYSRQLEKQSPPSVSNQEL